MGYADNGDSVFFEQLPHKSLNASYIQIHKHGFRNSICLEKNSFWNGDPDVY